MSQPSDELHRLWQAAKQDTSPTSLEASAMIAQARTHRRRTQRFHWINVAVLLLVVIGLGAFFTYLAPLQDTLSHIGIGFMIGSLLLRIGIEVYSAVISSRIDLSIAPRQALETARVFHRFRQTIHGPITGAIVALYSLGFFVLLPEFSRYFNLLWIVLMSVSYVIGAVFVTWQVRRGIRREMQALARLSAIEKELKQLA